MLLYTFWHWPLPATNLGTYERDEAAFQEAVLEARPAGLLASAVCRCSGGRWANDGGDAYEDSYLLENSAALDALNGVAVRGACKEPHDRLAAAMQSGTAGLYSLARGEPPRSVPDGRGFWLAKPAGMRYDEFYARLDGTESGLTIWRRFMVLSPAPEFCCFQSGAASTFPGHGAVAVEREVVCDHVALSSGSG